MSVLYDLDRSRAKPRPDFLVRETREQYAPEARGRSTPLAAPRPRPHPRSASVAQELVQILRPLRRAQALLTLQEARLLAWMHDRRAQQALSCSGFGDMVREWLHLTPRTAREHIALHRGFQRAPALEAAFLEGGISSCQAQVLLKLVPATPVPDHGHGGDGGDEALRWFLDQGRCSVPELRRRVQRRLRESGQANRQPGSEDAPPSASEPDSDEESFLAVRLDAPGPVMVEWDQTIELARASLGWDAPLYKCVEVMLIEAAPEAIALTASYRMSVEAAPCEPSKDACSDGPQLPPCERPTEMSARGPERAPAAQSASGPSAAMTRRSSPAAVTEASNILNLTPNPSSASPLIPRPEFEARARETLGRIREYLSDLQDLIESGEPKDPFDALDRLRQVQQLARPGRALLASLLRDLRDIGYLDRLGHAGVESFCERALGLSARAARGLRRQADHFHDSPELERAYAQGKIGGTQVARIARLASTNPRNTGWLRRRQEERQQRWIARATQVSVRQFEREARFLERLGEAGPSLAALGATPLPNPEVEPALLRALAEWGWDRTKVDETLQRAVPDAVLNDRKLELDSASNDRELELDSASNDRELEPDAASIDRKLELDSVSIDRELNLDPACNHLLMRRLEVLLHLLFLVSADEPPSDAGSIDRALILGGGIHAAARKTFAALPAPSSADDQDDDQNDVRDQKALHAWGTIRFSAPRPIVEHWREALRLAQVAAAPATSSGDRTAPAAASGDQPTAPTSAHQPEPLPAWAAVARLLRAAREVWELHDPTTVPTEKKLLRRDEYRCQVPGCTRRHGLHAHHVEFRSAGGSDAAGNKVILCAYHHAMLHQGLLRVTGTAPGGLSWELGLPPGRAPLRVYRGDRRAQG